MKETDKKTNSKSDYKKYNYIYKELVKNDDDLVGMIAYSLYKSEKIKYIQSLTEQKEEITDSDVENYNTSSKIRIKDYEDKALRLFTDFIDDIVDSKVKINREIIKEVVEETASPKGVRSWCRAITQSFIGGVFYTVAVFVILIFIWFFNSGIKEETQKKVVDTVKTELHNNKPSN